MSFHFRSYSESTPANARLHHLAPTNQPPIIINNSSTSTSTSNNNNNNDGVSSTTGDTNNNSKIEPNNNNSTAGQLPMSIHDGASNGIIRIHSDSQQSLDRLFNLSQGEASVPLRQRNLPSSFFNPTPVSKAPPRVLHQSLHCRSTSFNFAGQLGSQNQQSAQSEQPGARLNVGFHARTHSAQVTSGSVNSIVASANGPLVSIGGSQSSGLAASISSQSLHQTSPHVSQNNLASSSSQLNQIPNEPAPMQHFRAAAHNQDQAHHYRNYSSPSFTSHHHQPANIVHSQVHSNSQSSNHNHNHTHNQDNHQHQHQNGFSQQHNAKVDPYRQVVGSPDFMDTSTFANDKQSGDMFDANQLAHPHMQQPSAAAIAGQAPAPACQMHQHQHQFAGSNNGHVAAPMHYQAHSHSHPHPHSQPQAQPNPQAQAVQQHGHIVTEQPKFHIVHSYHQQPQQTFSGSYELTSDTSRQQPMQQPAAFGFAPNPTNNGYGGHHAGHHWNEANAHSNMNHCHSHQQPFGSNMAAVSNYADGNDWTTPNTFVNVAQKF